MTEDGEGTSALMIPDLRGEVGDLINVNIRPAARDHLLAWDASQRLVAIHESGHAVAAAALGIPVRVIDITYRHGGSTEVATPMLDTALPWETSGRMLDSMVVALAGSAAERVILGEHTSGGEADNDKAVSIAVRWIQAGFSGPGVFIGEDGLKFNYLTEAIRTRTIERVQEIFEAAQVRADGLMKQPPPRPGRPR